MTISPEAVRRWNPILGRWVAVSTFNVRDAIYDENCAYCQDAKVEGKAFFPPHTPSVSCNVGGKYPHCTCSACF